MTVIEYLFVAVFEGLLFLAGRIVGKYEERRIDK